MHTKDKNKCKMTNKTLAQIKQTLKVEILTPWLVVLKSRSKMARRQMPLTEPLKQTKPSSKRSKRAKSQLMFTSLLLMTTELILMHRTPKRVSRVLSQL